MQNCLTSAVFLKKSLVHLVCDLEFVWQYQKLLVKRMRVCHPGTRTITDGFRLSVTKLLI